MENVGYLLTAYLIFWFMVFGYLFSVSQRQKEVQKMLTKRRAQKS